LKKLFNIREGWRPDTDWLPERLLSETLPTGVARGVGLSRDELKEMIRGYYQAREWDRRWIRSRAEAGTARNRQVLIKTASR